MRGFVVSGLEEGGQGRLIGLAMATGSPVASSGGAIHSIGKSRRQVHYRAGSVRHSVGKSRGGGTAE